MARPGSWQRQELESAELSVEGGMPGDRWSATPHPPEQQLATMSAPVAELIANGQPLALFGDNLYVDLDLSSANLPVGSRLRVGEATLEVTPEPHNGCHQFRDRFGADALRVVSRRETRDSNLRGIYLRVIEPGTVRRGDAALVLSRG
jgi:MOSC domain-containing protein YiiM